ncbi:mannose-1-phosphate guanyltransferase alpha-like protein [Tanacetum coccineum]|uniref:Mannose-1-phosphate guanyltransferase alpha-like protein n=1 Tax=Tanacetum coccineum TaxID=301880 RepID=A0ABQ5BJI7_9ASTR
MKNTEEKVVAVIMVGGPTKGTRFRPLSFNTPKPLFPLAGQAMVHHPISACKSIPNLVRIFLVGFHEEREFALYVSSISSELNIPVRYLKEDKPHGSAGGLYYFKDLIMEDNPSHIVLLNCDVCCSFPLPQMLDAHRSYGGMGTLLVIKVSAESASEFGELVADPVTKELLHYTEKPETFVSDLINCGVYIFTPEIFDVIQDIHTNCEDRVNLHTLSSFEALRLTTKTSPKDFVRLDQDILSPLAGKKQLYTYETMDFWEQIKTPAMSLKCSALYLAQFRHTSPGLLASSNGAKNPTVVGDVYIHPSAKVHPTAKIGPNVSISANVRVAAGVRLMDCIILDDAEIQENAFVMFAIVGWKSSLGKWSRGDGDYKTKLGITILGEAVTVEDEVVVDVVNYIDFDHFDDDLMMLYHHNGNLAPQIRLLSNDDDKIDNVCVYLMYSDQCYYVVYVNVLNEILIKACRLISFSSQQDLQERLEELYQVYIAGIKVEVNKHSFELDYQSGSKSTDQTREVLDRDAPI